MRESRCVAPIDTAVLADYWLAALSPTEEEMVEEHLLACDECGDRLREFIALGEGIRKLARDGALRVVISESFLKRAAEQGLRVRQYAPPAGGKVDCTVTPQDDLLIGRLAVDLTNAKRVDLCAFDATGNERGRLRDIPINPSRKEVILNEPIDLMRVAPAHVVVMKLMSVEEPGERVLGEYTFNHTPS